LYIILERFKIMKT